MRAFCNHEQVYQQLRRNEMEMQDATASEAHLGHCVVRWSVLPGDSADLKKQ